MKIIGREKIHVFKHRHFNACSQFDAWEAEITEAVWDTPQDVKKRYAHASILPDNHVVFNIKGNRYRILVHINYKNKIVLVKKVGTHEEYMNW